MPLRSNKLRPIATTAFKSFIFTVLIIGLQQLQQINGKRVTLVPLTSSNVYRLVHDTLNRDDVPEGRLVTQGIAAAAGFTLGLTKALIGIFIYDVITADITEERQAVPPQTLYVTQEICFGTRATPSFEDAKEIADAHRTQKKKNYGIKPDKIRKRRSRRLKQNRNRNRIGVKNYGRKKRKPAVKGKAKKNIKTMASFIRRSPAENTAEAAGKSKAADGTSSITTTADNDQPPITCIVIRKPKK